VVNTTLGDFPPDPDVVTYSGEGLLVMPRDPDPKSQYMKDLAFYYGNGTAFVHDEVSSNYSLCPVTSQIKINLQDWTVTTYGPDGTLKDRGGDDLFIYDEDPGIGGFDLYRSLDGSWQWHILAGIQKLAVLGSQRHHGGEGSAHGMAGVHVRRG
jgi:hypothetical protein